jgi:hypothetical protein
MDDVSDALAPPTEWGAVILVRGTITAGAALTDYRFERVAGRLFLTGTEHNRGESNGVAGLRHAIAWDTVADVLSFRSLAEWAAWQEGGRAGDNPF